MKMVSSVKTQYTPLAVHMALVDLLRQIEPLFSNFTVYDDTEYWETGNLQRLFDRFAHTLRLLNKVAEVLRSKGISVETPNDRKQPLVN